MLTVVQAFIGGSKGLLILKQCGNTTQFLCLDKTSLVAKAALLPNVETKHVRNNVSKYSGLFLDSWDSSQVKGSTV